MIEDGAKIPQEIVSYRNATGPENCSSCVNFEGQGTCRVVAGTVSEGGLSDQYQPKEGVVDQALVEEQLFGPGGPAGPQAGMPPVPGEFPL